MMKKLTILCMAVTLTAGSMAFAHDVAIPPWRDAPGSTYQLWEFSNPDPMPVPDVVVNPYGMPTLTVKAAGDWEAGAWPLSGEIDVWIPNRPEICWWKDIQIQLTWRPADITVEPWDDNPLVGVVPGVDPYKSFMYSTTEDLGNGWMFTLYEIELIPNPPWERIAIKGDIWVDQVVIDTICIPEPATIGLLGLGALTLLRKRRV